MSAVTFIVFLIGAIGLVNIGVKTFVFQVEDYGYDYMREDCNRFMYGPKIVPTPEGAESLHVEKNDQNQQYLDCLEEQKEREEKQLVSPQVARDLSIGIAQILIAFPLWIFHWRKIEKERIKRN